MSVRDKVRQAFRETEAAKHDGFGVSFDYETRVALMRTALRMYIKDGYPEDLEYCLSLLRELKDHPC